MKHYLRMIVIGSALAMVAFASRAQDEPGLTTPRVARWVSEKGYWVVENNIKTPKNSMVFFYNNEDVLVYKEKVEGVKLNVTRMNTRMKLKKALETAVWAWEDKKPMRESTQLVSVVFREK